MERRKLIALLLLNAVVLAACQTLPNIYYEYEKPSVTTQRGFFNLTFDPEPTISAVDGKEVVLWTSPYLFNTQFISLDETVLKGELRNLEISESESGKRFLRMDRVLDIDRKMSSSVMTRQKGLLGFGADRIEMPYVDYLVKFDYTIYKSETDVFEEGRIEAVVKRNYYTGSKRQ